MLHIIFHNNYFVSSTEKSGKALHLSYEDNLKLVAFTMQVVHGAFNATTAPQVGVLDMIGKDRRIAWTHLGEISKAQSMEGFITLLDRLCSSFKPYVEAIKKDHEEKQRLAREEAVRQTEQQALAKQEHEDQQRADTERNREEQQRRQLQDALNQQTYHQFKAYAEKQFPGNPEQQAVLIRQLQTEHYHQYMQQLQAQLATMVQQNEAHTEKDSGGVGVGGDNEEDNKCYDENCPESDERDQCESDNESGGK